MKYKLKGKITKYPGTAPGIETGWRRERIRKGPGVKKSARGGRFWNIVGEQTKPGLGRANAGRRASA